MKWFISALAFFPLSILPTWAELPIIPNPASYNERTQEKGCLLHAHWKVTAPDEFSNEARVAEEIIAAFKKPDVTHVSTPTLSLTKNASLKNEAYILDINDKGITIEAASPSGIFYGLQTLKQLLPPDIYTQPLDALAPESLPSVHIEDAPLTSWRGVMLDPARQFQSKEFVKKMLDTMAVYKLNRFHWHLVDAEGWRIEIKKYPKLTQVGKGTPLIYEGEDHDIRTQKPHYQSGKLHGDGHYTQEDIKEIVAYAKARHIEIMPEIEFPGHANAALTAYPEFSTTKKVPTDFSNIPIELFGVDDASLGFLKDVLDEVAELFPFEMIHFGGDEAPKVQWKNDAFTQAKMKELGITDEDQLQAWMINELSKHIAKKGKRAVGWEEIMHGKNMETLDKNTVIMAWLSQDNAIKSAQNGYSFIHTSTAPFYIDSPQTHAPSDNWALYSHVTTLKNIYSFNLFPPALTDDIKDKMLGAQCQMWGYVIPRPQYVEYQLYPRLCALAELTWTPTEQKNYDDFYARLIHHRPILDAMKINYRYIDPLPLKNWTKDDLISESFSIPVTPADLPAGSQEAIIDFSYTQGPFGLFIDKVELIIGGETLSEDAHIGFSGHEKDSASYHLHFPALTPEMLSDARLRITHKNPADQKDSKGDIRLYADAKGIALFDFKNFTKNDDKIARWSRTPLFRNEQRLEADILPFVRTPGTYLLSLTKNEGPEAELSSLEGLHLTHKQTATLPKGKATAFIPITITETDIKDNARLKLKLKSSAPSSGVLRLFPQGHLSPSSNAKSLGLWTPQSLGAGWSIVRLTLPAEKDGKLTLSFHYQKGGNGLYIKDLKLMGNGSLIMEQPKQILVGAAEPNCTITFSSPLIKKEQSYTLLVQMAGGGGSDSYGEVTTP